MTQTHRTGFWRNKESFVNLRWANPRIQAQSGAFIICGMKMGEITSGDNTGTCNKECYRFEPIDIDGDTRLGETMELVTIPSHCKEGISSGLHLLGIDDMTLFPDIRHTIATTVNEVQQRAITRVPFPDN